MAIHLGKDLGRVVGREMVSLALERNVGSLRGLGEVQEVVEGRPTLPHPPRPELTS